MLPEIEQQKPELRSRWIRTLFKSMLIGPALILPVPYLIAHFHLLPLSQVHFVLLFGYVAAVLIGVPYWIIRSSGPMTLLCPKCRGAVSDYHQFCNHCNLPLIPGLILNLRQVSLSGVRGIINRLPKWILVPLIFGMIHLWFSGYVWVAIGIFAGIRILTLCPECKSLKSHTIFEAKYCSQCGVGFDT